MEGSEVLGMGWEAGAGALGAAAAAAGGADCLLVAGAGAAAVSCDGRVGLKRQRCVHAVGGMWQDEKLAWSGRGLFS